MAAANQRLDNTKLGSSDANRLLEETQSALRQAQAQVGSFGNSFQHCVLHRFAFSNAHQESKALSSFEQGRVGTTAPELGSRQQDGTDIRAKS